MSATEAIGRGLLHDVLAAQAVRMPDDVAVRAGERALTYSELSAQASAISAHLRSRGVAVGTNVSLCMHRSPELVAAIFGILRAGAVCVPVDPEDPLERREAIVAHSGAEFLLGDEAGLPMAAAGVEAVAVADALAGDASAPPAAELAPTSLAFLFYTSGSTGTPKGVMLSHQALLSGQCWLAATFPLDPGAAQLLRTTLSVTNLVREVFWPILAGGTIVVVPPGQHKDPDALVELVDRHQVVTLLVVPALLAGMLERPAFRGNRSLRYLFSSSDVMPGDLPERFFESGVPARLFNLYGLTEALYACCWECLPGVEYRGFVPVGRAAELTPEILNADLGTVADGEVGELCLSGSGIAEGYFRQPELTAEKFVEAATGRVYRTGDLARRLEDGCVELLGRGDDQVKISGYRVELGEVEACLRRGAEVEEAVVVPRRGLGAHQRLVAYIRAADGATVTVGALRSRLGEALPPYMVPAAFMLVDEIPLSHGGKVDRQALEGLGGSHLELDEEYVAPRGPTERFLTALWEDVLAVPRVGVHDNFFALGGDSIQGFLVSARLNRLGAQLQATQVFDSPTVAEMSWQVEERLGQPLAAEYEPLAPEPPPPARKQEIDDDTREQVAALAADPAGIEALYPLTDMQKGMLFHSLLDPGSGVYFEQFVYRLGGELDVDAYRRAWRQVVDRHEILRAWIAFDGLAEPLQAIQRDAALEFTIHDWVEVPPEEQWSRLERHLLADRRRDFDYAEAPLFRVTLIRLGKRSFKLILSYHHLILDAWSLFVLLRDSLELYGAAVGGPVPQLEPTRSFGDYVDLVRAKDAEPSRRYWEERLAGFRAPTVIGKAEKLGLFASSLDLHAEARLDLGEELTRELLAYGRRHRLTLNSLVQGAWGMVLASLSGRSDVCFGITITHRPVELQGVEDLVGIFINTLPMRLVLESGQAVGDWLAQVQRVQVAARAHEHYPLPLIQERSEMPNDQPLFETLLIFENFPRGSGWTDRGGMKVRQDRYIGWTNYPFAIEAMPEEQLFFQVKYDEAFFDSALVDCILTTFREILELIASGEGGPLGEVVGPLDAAPSIAVAGELPTRGQVVQPSPATMAAPATAAEEVLERVWAEALRLERVDVHAGFLQLGGNSLAAMRILALCRRQGFDFELGQLFGPQSSIHHIAQSNSLARPERR